MKISNLSISLSALLIVAFITIILQDNNSRKEIKYKEYYVQSQLFNRCSDSAVLYSKKSFQQIINGNKDSAKIYEGMTYGFYSVCKSAYDSSRKVSFE